MYDLIYLDNYTDYKEVKDVIKREFSNAKIEDASDQIHEHRFSVDLDIKLEDWFMFLLNKQFPLHSLTFQIVARKEPDRIKKLIDKLKVVIK